MDPTVKIPPGVVRGASQSDTAGTWYEANLVRWVKGVACPVPGWEIIVAAIPLSKMRAVHPWIDNDGISYVGVLCEENLYVFRDGDIYDVTPIGGMTGPGDNVLAGGYGDDEYSLDEYGTPRPDKEGSSIIGPVWSLDNWGETLVAMSSYDGRLLQWSPATPLVHAVAVTGAPTNNRFFVVTPQRHVVLFGMGNDYRHWGWCSQEDINDWNFASTTNTAGEFFIEPASPLICGKSIKSGIIFFTATKAYFASYLGVPYVYGYSEIGENLTPITAASLAASSDKVSWWAENGFWTYESGSLTPVDCTLLDWLRNESDPSYRRIRPFGMAIGSVTEVWWFFPTVGATENNKYVSWNYVTGEWSMGILNRTCGVAASFLNYPIMSDGDKMYYHENGLYYGANPLPYLESASINLKSGGKISTISQAIPDHDGTSSQVKYKFFGRFTRCDPNTAGEQSKEVSTRADGYLDVRMTARDFRMRISSAANGVPPWSFGEMIMKIFQRGGR